MKKIESKALKLANAVVLVHEWSAGTAILSVTGTKEPWQHTAIWVNEDEVTAVVELLQDWRDRKLDGD